MLDACRKDRLVRFLVTTALVWGFVLPVVHLACGMETEVTSALCDHESSASEAESSIEAHDHDHNARTHERRAHNHDDAARTIEQLAHVSEALYSTSQPAVECCWIDTVTADRQAPLPTLVQAPEISVTLVNTSSADAIMQFQEPYFSDEAAVSQPRAYHLLFSVFLI